MPKIIVKSITSTFRRAGIEFTRAGVELDTGKLKKSVLEALRAEPRLVITEIEPTAADKKAAAAAAKAEAEAAKAEAEAAKAEAKTKA